MSLVNFLYKQAQIKVNNEGDTFLVQDLRLKKPILVDLEEEKNEDKIYELTQKSLDILIQHRKEKAQNKNFYDRQASFNKAMRDLKEVEKEINEANLKTTIVDNVKNTLKCK